MTQVSQRDDPKFVTPSAFIQADGEADPFNEDGARLTGSILQANSRPIKMKRGSAAGKKLPKEMKSAVQKVDKSHSPIAGAKRVSSTV